MARRLGILVACMLLFALPALADDGQEQGERLDEIVRLAEEGVTDAVIVKHIATSGFVFYLSADDILELRALGVSDTVIEALIDTAIGEQPRRRRSRIEYDDDDDRTSYVVVSAGYFSPWYWYPYAWGFYYDPFPSCYSYYYYPFRCATWWGYYGSCNAYYYARSWRSYRYDSWPYYDELCRRRGSAVRVPVEGPGRAQFAVARAQRPAAGVIAPAGAPPRFGRADARGRDATPRLDAARRSRTRIHTREAARGEATPSPSRRWSTPPPQAREATRPAERRAAPPTRQLEPNSGMRVRQGANAAPPSNAPGRPAAPSASAPSRPAAPSASAPSRPAARPAAPAAPAAPPPPPSGSKLRIRP